MLPIKRLELNISGNSSDNEEHRFTLLLSGRLKRLCNSSGNEAFMATLCDRQLRRWYREYNARYFGGALPDDIDLLYAPHKGCAGRVDFDDNAGHVLLINPSIAIDVAITRLTLLHEMNHLHLYPYIRHGKPFQDGMLRLAKLGALKGLW